MPKICSANRLDAEGLLIQGPTVEMIEGEVNKLNIDLLVLGSHKHGFLYETFVGNTAFQDYQGSFDTCHDHSFA